ncbi:MAG: NAD(P)-dependent oxidoreductase, partial [Pseudomonadota bacterium]
MKILITGGSAPIAESIIHRLLSQDHEIVVFDIQQNLALPEAVTFIRGDIRDFDAVANAGRGCDTGLHLVALAGSSKSEDIINVNVSGAYAFFIAARKNHFSTAVLASSAPVHLPPDNSDDDLLLRTSNDSDHVYDLTKSLQEVMARDFFAHGLPVTCLRFGHIVDGSTNTNLDDEMPLAEFDYCRGG